jgi:hypothetical protein
MHSAIQVRSERKRGCGYRTPGGLYLVCDLTGRPCGKLPVKLDVCPTCGSGFKFARGWTWVNGTALFADRECLNPRCPPSCPLAGPIGRCGLLWIGEKFYKTPFDWLREVGEMGVSRRIKGVPKDFVLHSTWVLVAHIHGVENPDGSKSPAIFNAFKPSAIEYVTTGKESDEDIESLLNRGITPVKVERIPEKSPLFGD